jgi:adenosine deaminase
MIDPNFPLIDLHRHLDGNVRLETILDLGQQHAIELPAWDVEGLRPYVQVTEPQPGVMAFISKFEWMMAVLADEEACFRIAHENVEDASREGIDYLELRFSPMFMAESHSLDLNGVVKAVYEGVKEGQRDFGVRTNLIGILSRTYGPEAAWNELNALLSKGESLVALDLAGDEIKYPASLFKEHFQSARAAGLKIIAHAGESAGPESIWAAIDELGAERIGHAVNAPQDPSLMDTLAERRIGIECNLTSNVQTSIVADYASHPIGEFLENGLLATINTDDPAVSGIDLPFEYQVAAPKAGLSVEQIWRAQHNALEAAFLSTDEKAALVAQKWAPA